MVRIIACIIIIWLGFGWQASAQYSFIVRVIDKDNEKPLPFATLKIENYGKTGVCDEKGMFVFNLPATAQSDIILTASYVGKKEWSQTIELGRIRVSPLITCVMESLSLKMVDVEVNAVRMKAQSNSSFIISRTAIDQIQAYSLDDVLQLLPGKTIKNTNLQGSKSLTLRTTATGAYANNNAFGTAIYIDGVALSNNANMQADDIGRWGSIRTFNAQGYTSGDYAGSGFDLRQVPVADIENIEVISGVAPAKYGDVSDGAVIIERQAGISPLRTSVRLQTGTTNISLGKGFKLKGKGGMMTTSFDYINSVADKRDKLKSFNRINAGILWTKGFGKRELLKNTLSLDVYTNLDDAKVNPDEGNERMTYFKNYGFRFSDRGSISINRKWLQSVSYTVSTAYGVQDSYDQWYLNQGVFPVSAGLTTGTYEGEFAPPNYLGVREIKGKPFSASGRLELATGILDLMGMHHRIMAGFNMNYDDNFGEGRLFNPLRPRFKPQSFISERPYYFGSEIHLAQYGFYMQDDITTKIGKKVLKNNWGVRIDKQGQYWSIAPRLNSSMEINRSLSVQAAFGISSKAPGLAHLYPSLLYYDIPRLSYYTNNPKENLYLVHTEVVNPRTNIDLKNSTGNTIELGLQWRQPKYNFSVTAYQKINRNGFAGRQILYPMILPQYVITSTQPNQKPVYNTNGLYDRYMLTYGQMTNALYTRNRGVEFIFSTRTIRAIQTSFDFSTVYNHSYYYNPGDNLVIPSVIDYSKEAIIGIIKKDRSATEELISTLSTSHHVPVLGLLINWRIQAFWMRQTDTYGYDGLPVAYISNSFNRVEIPEKDRASDAYQHIRGTPLVNTDTKQPIIVTNYHLRIGKEIDRKYRISFYANNFFNYRPYVVNSNGDRVLYNEDPAFGAEVSLRF